MPTARTFSLAYNRGFAAKQIAEAVNRAKNRGYFKFILGGHGPSSAPEFFMQKLGADAVVIGEGEFILPRIGHYLSIGETIIKDKVVRDLDSYPWPAYDLFPIDYYAAIRWPTSKNTDRCMPILSGRGCKWKCLHGETLINTIDGMKPIKELVGKKIKVLTYDKEKDEILFASAINIIKTQKNAQLVRVSFNDGTHIDCTPDHKFKKFINGNQKT